MLLFALLYPSLISAAHLSTRQSNLDSCFTSANITTVVSTDAGYANASLAYNRRLQYQPTAIVYPTSPQDVQSVIKCASGSGVPVVARSGGHSYAAFGLGGQNGALVVDLSKLKSLTVDASTGYAVSQTGNTLGELAQGIWAQGQRALPHGTCPYVGTGGHAAYGGYGLFSRTAGLLLDRVVSADVVLANGTLVTATNTSNTDLFWALRGAAPSFGIVTSWTFATLAAPTTTINWQLTFSAALSSQQVIDALVAYQTFAFSAPNNDLSVVLYMAPVTGGSLQISFSGSFYGSEDDFTNVITPLKNSLPGTTLDVKTYDWIDGLTSVDGPLSTVQPDTHDNFFAKSLFANSQFSNDSWSSWVTYLTTTGASSDINWWVQIDLYAGVIATVGEDDTSYAHRDSVLNFQFYGAAPTSAAYPADGIDFMNNLVAALTTTPYAAYPNYADPTLTPDQWHSLYFGSHYQRLTVIKRDVDPNNLFSFPQSIEVAAAGVTTAAGSAAAASQTKTTAASKNAGSITYSISFLPGLLCAFVALTLTL